MTLLAGILDTHTLVELGARDRNAVIRTRIHQVITHALVLEVRHMTTHTAIAGGIGLMMRMPLGSQPFACMATGALPVIKTARQGITDRIAIVLTVRLMAIDAGHGAIQVTIAIEISRLIPESFDTSVRCKTLLEYGQLQRKIIFQPRTRQIRFLPNGVFRGMTLKADVEGLILAQGRECFHPDIGRFFKTRFAYDLDMTPARPVTGFTIDLQGLEASIESAVGFVIGHRNLAAVTILAVRKLGQR